MKIKAKLYLSQLFLVGVIAAVASIGVYYLHLVAEDTANILKDNYRSIEYMRKIDLVVDDLKSSFDLGTLTPDDLDKKGGKLTELVQYQLANITETGESSLTENLSTETEAFLKALDRGISQPDVARAELLKRTIAVKTLTETIFVLNEETILDKSAAAKTRSEQVILYMILIGASGIIFGLILFLGLPNYIVNPIKQFTKSIKEISGGNYAIQIPFEGDDELGGLAKSIRKMVIKLKEYEKSNLVSIIKEQKRLALIVNQMNEAILVMDENKTVILCNTLLLDLVHMDREQVQGRHIQEVARVNNLIENITEDLFVPLLDGEQISPAPVRIFKGGKERVFKKEIMQLSEDIEGGTSKKLIGHLVILSDVTEYAEKDQAKLKFMATLSHELKTPLAAIQLSTKLLENSKMGQLSEEQSDLIQTIKSNQERIRRMVNEVLEISQINQGFINLQLEEFSVHDSITDSLKGLDLFLKEKELQLSVDLPETLPLLEADYHKSVWIFNNLISNAIRHSPTGGTIRIHAEVENKKVRVEISDQGSGISQQNQGKIFEHFVKLEPNAENGTGLGLAISKEFMEAMGGSIGVQSAVGKGSTFWVKFRHS
jgi:two-component system, NtrC family, sensor histidine kinase KinB